MRCRYMGRVVGLVALLAVFSVAGAEDDDGGVVVRAKPGPDLEAMARTTFENDEKAFRATLDAIHKLSASQTRDLMTRVRRMARARRSENEPVDTPSVPMGLPDADRPIVTIEARILEVPRGSFDVHPTAQDPVRYLDDLQTEVILRAAEKNERISVLAAPRLSAFSGQQANISAVNQTSFVQDYDVETTKDGAVADPIIGVLTEGLVLDLRPVLSVDGKYITVEMDGTWSKLARPIPEMEISVRGGHKVKVQLPEISTHRLKAHATMPSGGAALIGGGPLVNRDGTAYARMVLLRVTKTSFEDATKPK